MTNMTDIFARLEDAGLPKRFVMEKTLPSWWEGEVASTNSGFQQTLYILSQRLGFSFQDLLHPDQVLEPRKEATRFKTNKGADVGRHEIAALLAAQVAKILLASMPDPPVSLVGQSAEALKARLLDSNQPWIGLDEVVGFCWTAGIPVFHLPIKSLKLGAGVTTPAVASINVRDRFAIALFQNFKSEARTLFIVAHELGHIASGHLSGLEVFVDDKVEQSTEDPVEKAANAYAVRLLCGDETSFGGPDSAAPQALADAARRLGVQRRVDPGHVLLNYAYNNNSYALAHKALGLVESQRAIEYLRRILSQNINLDKLGDDDVEFVQRLTGLE